MIERNKTILILCSGLVFFTAVTILTSVIWPNDEQMFTVFSSAFTAFLGATMMHLRGDHQDPR